MTRAGVVGWTVGALSLLGTPGPGEAAIVVNQVQTGGLTSASDEFVEILNTGPAALDLGGYSVVYRSAAGTTDILLGILPPIILGPGSSYVLGGSQFPGHANQYLVAGTGLAAAGGGVGIREPGGTLLDSVGWGTATNSFVETAPAPAPQPGWCIVRHPPGYDTNNNAGDFMSWQFPNPIADPIFADGFSPDVPIQAIQDGSVPSGSVVRVYGVFMTANRGTSSVVLYVQEPEGRTTPPHTYPEYAGMGFFATAAEAAAFGLVGLPTGSCVRFTATTSEFNGATQVLTPTSFGLLPRAACGTPPLPLSVPGPLASFADIATDPPGARAEVFEGVLLSVSNVFVAAAPDPGGEFPIATSFPPTGPTLTVDNAFYSLNPPFGASYSSLTGVYNQNTSYRLYPRTAADAVP